MSCNFRLLGLQAASCSLPGLTLWDLISCRPVHWAGCPAEARSEAAAQCLEHVTEQQRLQWPNTECCHTCHSFCSCCHPFLFLKSRDGQLNFDRRVVESTPRLHLFFFCEYRPHVTLRTSTTTGWCFPGLPVIIHDSHPNFM